MTSPTRTTAAALLAAIAVTCTATACTSEANEPAPPTTSTEQPPLSGVDSAGRSPGQQATEGAIAAVEGMYKAELAVEGDLRADMNVLGEYMADPYLGLLKEDINLRRSHGIVSDGELRLVRSHPEEVDAPSDEDGNPIKGVGEVLLKTCTDVSDYRSIAPDGRDTVDPDRLTQAQAIYRVVNADWPDASGWRVVENTLAEVEECDAY